MGPACAEIDGSFWIWRESFRNGGVDFDELSAVVKRPRLSRLCCPRCVPPGESSNIRRSLTDLLPNPHCWQWSYRFTLSWAEGPYCDMASWRHIVKFLDLQCSILKKNLLQSRLCHYLLRVYHDPLTVIGSNGQWWNTVTSTNDLIGRLRIWAGKYVPQQSIYRYSQSLQKIKPTNLYADWFLDSGASHHICNHLESLLTWI
jgi:hypothetical protein